MTPRKAGTGERRLRHDRVVTVAALNADGHVITAADPDGDGPPPGATAAIGCDPGDPTASTATVLQTSATPGGLEASGHTAGIPRSVVTRTPTQGNRVAIGISGSRWIR